MSIPVEVACFMVVSALALYVLCVSKKYDTAGTLAYTLLYVDIALFIWIYVSVLPAAYLKYTLVDGIVYAVSYLYAWGGLPLAMFLEDCEVKATLQSA